ncbi:[protein-PII] uridylyltransferase [Pelobacter propionicus]|uniref:Bifunctional uridylyltransferase/uridylyl-removing enzyme n=1 Tax=Pelobacter propionicus (strain DSM 2379 / NBRC 103807 / OttBd1) TaxID=338966 RepID=A1ANP3_PELPD|nr:[protein-PII] uridylyltransferase [Pelobacter propionicus]ABK98963.1 UTP-GlnB uridylyltransferase, GlnD [Pelobacter propionicus DSM 2379]
MHFSIDSYFPDDIHEVGDTGMAGFEEKRPLYFSGSKNFLSHYREEIRKRHNAGASGSEVTHLISRMMDELIKRLFHSIVDDLDISGGYMDHINLVAVGGYGRGELNPYSDIDIMFLHDGDIPVATVEDIAQKLLYFLWDMRLDVGYSVRTIGDCIEMAASDGTVKTALMDARNLKGSTSLFTDLHKTIFSQILPRSSDKFIKSKVEEMKARREKYGSTVYLLEPNLKEGEGGLRDLQTALWVARIKYKFSDPRELIVKGVVTEEELDSYFSALDFLWRIRNELHYFSGRKNEQLTFDAQVHLAQFFGYKQHERVLAVEDFMRDYYRHANRVEYLVSTLVSRCVWRDEGALKILGYFVRRPIGDGCFILKGELIVPDEGVVERQPVVLMRIFELAQKHGVELGIPVMGLVRRSLHMVNDKFRRSREVGTSFMNILRAPRGVARTLRLMHHLEFLNHFIPEMELIYCKVQHDVYHIFTVDIHTLFAVEQAEKMLAGELKNELRFPCQVAAQVNKPELLYLAVLLHDIGKGSGGSHADKGAAMIPTIARRLGLSRECSERLEFLVRRHLYFAHIAQRRDLGDEKMIIQFARHMETSENLKMLYLLTVADIRAVGVDVWTTWKALLFQELYERAFDVLERGDFRLEASSERVKSVMRKVAGLLGNECAPTAVQAELRAMPMRLLLSHDPDQIAGHIRLLLGLGLGGAPVLTRLVHNRESGYSEFTICTHDMPGLFSRITGVMAANGINILGAQINTSRNGKVLDILQVNSPRGKIIGDENCWKKVRDDTERVLLGEADVAAMVDKRQRPSQLMVRPAPRFPTRIDFDNQVSEGYTVIDIYTHDKVGLLYLITSTLTQLGLYIGVSKISTKVDQVADVFYVRDIFGHKIMDEAKLESVRERLKSAIDGWV